MVEAQGGAFYDSIPQSFMVEIVDVRAARGGEAALREEEKY